MEAVCSAWVCGMERGAHIENHISEAEGMTEWDSVTEMKRDEKQKK
jgi:hypothetical protein